MKLKDNKSQIIIYETEKGEPKIDVRFQDETVWLNQIQMFKWKSVHVFTNFNILSLKHVNT